MKVARRESGDIRQLQHAAEEATRGTLRVANPHSLNTTTAIVRPTTQAHARAREAGAGRVAEVETGGPLRQEIQRTTSTGRRGPERPAEKGLHANTDTDTNSPRLQNDDVA